VQHGEHAVTNTGPWRPKLTSEVYCMTPRKMNSSIREYQQIRAGSKIWSQR
jgi:ribosomal protein S12